MKHSSSGNHIIAHQMCRVPDFFYWIFAVIGCFTLLSCQSLPKGCGPYPENYQSMVMDYLQHDLKYPESIKDFKIIKAPETEVLEIRIPPLGLKKGFEVWESFIVYDVKNDSGAYIGRDLHVVWFRGNRLIAFDYRQLNPEYRMMQKNYTP